MFYLFRSNSKASYLPRQSREKLNVDPDHGVYKRTLTSNEDFVNHNNHHNNNQSAYHQTINTKSTDILSSKCNNLPDVLPIGAKIHSPSSQTPTRYGSNNNIHIGNLSTGQPHQNYHQQYHQHSAKMPQTAPPHPQHNTSSGYSMKSVFNFNRSSSNHPASLTSPTPLNTYNNQHRDANTINHNNESILSKLVSQSNIDLVKSHILNLSAAHDAAVQSQISVASHQNGHTQFSPVSSSRQSSNGTPRPELGRKLSLEDRTNNFNNSPNINRSASTVTPPKKETTDSRVIRKDSLKENIDKITQLQSQLMSAHLQEQEKQNVMVKRDTSLWTSPSTVEPNLNAAPEVDRQSPVVETITTTPPPPLTPQPSSPTRLSISKSPPHLRSSLPAAIQQLEDESEVVVRLSQPPPTTAEVGSQTDESALRLRVGDDSQAALPDIFAGTSEWTVDSATDSKSRCRQNGLTSIDLDCQQLSQELVRQLSPSDRLHQILVPKSFRSSSYYITGLYNPYIAPRAVKKDVGTSTPSESPVHRYVSKQTYSLKIINNKDTLIATIYIV